MPYNTAAASGSDWEKLQLAWHQIRDKMGSLHDVLEAFGLADLPLAQRYGILFGCLVFVVTVSTVVILLIVGGSFRRIAEQSIAGTAVTTPSEVRAQRPLLLETLLAARERLMQRYSKNNSSNNSPYTPLTRLLLQQAPDAPLEMEDEDNTNSTLTDENTTPDPNQPPVATNNNDKNKTNNQRYIPPMYQEHYLEAYRTCQDKPGGPILSGRPEARYEAYARAYAGCGGPYVNRSYRRSYARRYEALRCRSHGTDDQFALWARNRPHDLIGQSIRLEALETDRHVVDVFHVTSGRPALENTAYDPHEVWGFWEEGPFASPTELAQSFVFQRRHSNEAAFAIVHAVTEQVWGVILLRHDDPANLSVQLEPPILPPSRYGTVEQLEACFLLMDRLFAHGYRRIQMAIDAQDAEQRQLSRRVGMTLEGCLCKHRIVKEANRDSHIYSMTNSDWNAKEGGARAALFGKLYGAKALRADQANALKEEERDEQEWGLAEQKRVAEQEEQQPQQPESKKKV